ncbi:hypothetical protein [uncultured Campylobacter sp.]|uniref:hypothetical protein n=2 Tax=uncultured Campylobacter sp. TaxID=218934 RepID=UPI002611CF62|nr:hypothetical protein [uncultured Campylobacter sp.]
MKKILAGSDFKLKGSVKGRVRVASRDGAIVNFTAADFGVQSLNDKISLSGEQFERFRARIFGILNSGGRELAGRLTLSSTPKKKARADRLRAADGYGYAEFDGVCDFGSFCEGDLSAVSPEAGDSLAKTSYTTNARRGERDFSARSAHNAQDFTSQAEFQDVSQAEFYGAARAEFCVDTAWDTACENLISQNDAAQDDMSVGLAASFEESANARSEKFMPQSSAPANSAKEQSLIPASRNFISAQSSALVKDSVFGAQNSNFMAQAENFAAENSFVAEQGADLRSKNSTAQSSASKNSTFANSALDIKCANDCKPQGSEFSKGQSANFAGRRAANFALENASEFTPQDENCVGENSAFLAKGQNYAPENSDEQNLAQKSSAQERHPLNLPPQAGNKFVPEFEQSAQPELTGENSTFASSMAKGALGDEPASAAFGSESTFAAKPVNFYDKPARKAPTKERSSLRERPQALPIASASRPISLPQAPRARLIELKPRFIGIAHRIKISFLKKSASEPGEGVLARVRIPLLMENFGLNDILSSTASYQMAKKMVRTIADLYIAKDLRGVHIGVPVRLEMGFKSGISDVSNHAFIFKLIEDSLVKNGVIDDDNADIVREIKLFKQDVFDGVLVNIVRFE